MILNPANYQFEPFDLEKALAGKPLAATFDNNGTITYKLVEQFYRESSDFALYKVLIESTYYTFNSDGIGTVTVGEGASAEEVTSQLYICIGIIDPIRQTANNDITVVGPDGSTQPFYLPSLNFRETVALQALNAIIGHYDNPIGYNAASVKLMITKAFEFAGEFVNQAVKLRKENAAADPDHSGEYIVTEDSPEIAALKDIKNSLDEIADALDNSIDAQTIADGIDQSSALQAINGVLSTDTNNIQSKVNNIATDTTVIREALHDPNNANNTIYGKVSDIREHTSYIQGISVFVEDIDNKIS